MVHKERNIVNLYVIIQGDYEIGENRTNYKCDITGLKYTITVSIIVRCLY